jgi:hypothetical protein
LPDFLPPPVSPTLPFDIAISTFLPRACHGRTPQQFPESSEEFFGCGEQFHKIAMMENGRGGKEKR